MKTLQETCEDIIFDNVNIGDELILHAAPDLNITKKTIVDKHPNTKTISIEYDKKNRIFIEQFGAKTALNQYTKSVPALFKIKTT